VAAIQSAERTATYTQASGIRPFDLGRDLRPVADLIADAFRYELDERGAAALREVRNMSRLGGLIRVLNLTTGDLDGFFGGYVWVEEGQVVGNITVQKSDKFGSRWQIANVAVANDFRGRGISRKLMERALRHVREAGGKWATLQVYEANTIARTLYDHLGFEVVGGVTDLEARRLPPLAGPPPNPEALARGIAHFVPFQGSQWQSLYELANNQYGAAAQWWRPLRRSDYQSSLEAMAGELFWSALGRRHLFRRAIQPAQRFEAALLLTAQRWSGSHRLQLWVRPEHYGAIERPLVQWAMATLRDYPTLPVVASVPNDHLAALEALREAGLNAVRTLLTMRLDVAPEPTEAPGV
jgi:ribosomal protein S18 acetylase RimI-like enzyme